MSDVPDSVIARLNSMDGYEQMLEIDRVTVEHGVTEEELMRLMDAARGAAPESTDPVFDESLSRSKSVDYDLEPTHIPSNKPEALENAHRFRMGYDPSEGGRVRQSQVEQAIVCSACRSPLGIPSIRPIRVTCPHCMHESLFEN